MISGILRQYLPEKDMPYILDVDLDFFSTKNPFRNLYERANLYEKLTKLYWFKRPSSNDPEVSHCLGIKFSMGACAHFNSSSSSSSTQQSQRALRGGGALYTRSRVINNYLIRVQGDRTSGREKTRKKRLSLSIGVTALITWRHSIKKSAAPDPPVSHSHTHTRARARIQKRGSF